MTRRLLCLALTVIILLIFLLHQFYTRPRQSSFAGDAEAVDDEPPSVHDLNLYRSHIGLDAAEFHIVIAHHDEEPLYIRRWLDDVRSLPYAQELGVHTIVYTKPDNRAKDHSDGKHTGREQEQEQDLEGFQVSTEAGLQSLKIELGADSAFILPNTGREGSTYLHYIIEHYDRLPSYTLFAQADLHKGQRLGSGPEAGRLRTWLQQRLAKQFQASPIMIRPDRPDGVQQKTHGNFSLGFMSLNGKHDLCYCGDCTDMGGHDIYPLWSQLYAIMHGQICVADQPNLMSFHAGFIVSRKRILQRPKEFYHQLSDLVNAPNDRWLHKHAVAKWFLRSKGPSTSSNPWFGHTLERLWHEIFDCGRIDQVVGCEPNLSRHQGSGGCSCLD